MAYSTLDDIKKSLTENSIIQLTDDEGTGTANQQRVDKAIADADEIINGYLRGHYDVPLSPAPGLVNKFSVEVSIFNLYSRRPETEMPATVLLRYKEALRFLEQVQKGVASLGVSEESSIPEGEYKTTKTSEDREFTKELLDSF